MDRCIYLEEYQRMANAKEAPDVPSLAESMESMMARMVMSAFTEWKLAGKPAVR